MVFWKDDYKVCVNIWKNKVTLNVHVKLLVFYVIYNESVHNISWELLKWMIIQIYLFSSVHYNNQRMNQIKKE